MDLRRQFLGWERFPDGLAAPEIARFFSLSPDERQAVLRHRRPLNRLGVALQIGHMRLTGLSMNNVEMIAPQILAQLGKELGVDTPQLASIRALYRRRRTLYEHQAAAKKVLGLRDLTDHAEWSLTGFLRREAGEKFDTSGLVTAARGWLADHNYLQLPARRLTGLAIAARRHHDDHILSRIRAAVGVERCTSWAGDLLETMESGKMRMEWLRSGPASRKPRGLADQVAKITFLKQLGAEKLDLGISTILLKALARPMLYRKPATLRRMRSERKTLEIACFLRLQLLRLTDEGLGMIDYRIADLWRAARGCAEEAIANELRQYQHLVLELAPLSQATDMPAAELRMQLQALLFPFVANASAGPKSKVGRVRQELATQQIGSTELLRAVAAIGFDVAPGHPLAQAMATLNGVAASGNRSLPSGVANPFGPTWARILNQPNRERGLAGFKAATLMLIKRSLRNGSASVRHSLEHQAPDDRLIPRPQWHKDRARFVRELDWCAKPESMIRWLKDELASSLTTLAAAHADGRIRIEKDRLVVPRLKPVEEDEKLKAIRDALFEQVGKVQLPDLLVEADATIRFSWILLGRAARSEKELVMLYAALIALGSNMTAADMARMTHGLEADSVGDMIMRIEANGRLPEANRLVLDYFRTLPVAQLWGAGLDASADMMSLDVTGRHWSARHDPRRRTPAIGTYTHVLDQWAILHNQPIVLNRRQAGAAIEGALRHEQIELGRVAVDTHGFTHFAMALAKLVGFDLCPRLAHLSHRKLYLPRGLDVPDSLRPIVRETVSTKAIVKGWDPLLRIAASVKSGWCSATYVLDRFGSAAHGDLAFKAGDALGRLLRTRYFSAYLGDMEYRTMIHALLSQGESVHTLQRAIHAGPVGAKRGRTPEQIAAISASLALLTNIVMTWNATRIGNVRTTAAKTFPDHQLKHIVPIAHGHINMRGVMTFDLSKHRAKLVAGGTPVSGMTSMGS